MKNAKLTVLTAAISLGTVACGSYYDGDRRAERTRTPSTQSRQADTGFISAENIREVERVLQSQGYNPGPVDGRMDERTQQALRRFQDVRNIPQTGVLDRATVGQLEKAGANFTGNLGAMRRDDRVYPEPYIP